MKWTQYLLIIALIVSVIANLLLFFSLGVYAIDSENTYNENSVEWCSLANDHIDIINDLLISLQYYDIEYEIVELLENLDCFGGDYYSTEIN